MKVRPLFRAFVMRLALATAAACPAAAVAGGPSLLIGTWSDPSVAGHVEVTSSVSADTYTYQVTNVDYNPEGGLRNVGVWFFAPFSANADMPPIVSVSGPAGWVPQDFDSFFSWDAGHGGPGSGGPNNPNVGLLPGQSAVFSFVSLGSEPTITTGVIASAFASGNVISLGTSQIRGFAIFPSPISSPVPEPAMRALVALGLLGLCFLRGRRTRG